MPRAPEPGCGSPARGQRGLAPSLARCLSLVRPAGRESPSEKLNVAVVGCGGRGGREPQGRRPARTSSPCATWTTPAPRPAFKRFPKAKKFRDFRKMLDEIAAADRRRRGQHARPHARPRQPRGHAPRQARLLREAAHLVHRRGPADGRNGQAAQGRHANGHAGHGRRRLAGGRRGGPLRRARARSARCTSGPTAPRGGGRRASIAPRTRRRCPRAWTGTSGSASPPSGRITRPTCPFKWRGWKDFGTGPAGRHGDPQRRHAVCRPAARAAEFRGDRRVARASRTRRFPPGPIAPLRVPGPRRAAAAGAPLVRRRQEAARPLIGGRKVAENGAILVGEKGTLYSIEWTGGDWHLLPEEKFRDFKPPEPTEPRSPGHHAEWIRACKGGPPAYCNFIDFAAPITETDARGRPGPAHRQEDRVGRRRDAGPELPRGRPLHPAGVPQRVGGLTPTGRENAGPRGTMK